MSPKAPISETAALLVLAAVHFVNLVDFVMVMPLGPDFALALGIPMSSLGVVGGSYTASATVIGALGSVLLDRFERRGALTLAVIGLGFSTMAAALASGTWSLVAARAAAGAFGGVAATLCFSIVADIVPEARRGKGTAIVASGFSLASILGLPAGLELARRGTWKTPFIVVGVLALALALMARLLLPRLRGHMDAGADSAPLEYDAKLWLAFLAFGFALLGNFMLVPNLSAYLQFNMGFPRESLGMLYLLGGLGSLLTMRLSGVWTDRSGAFLPVAAASVVVSVVVTLGAVVQPPILAPALFFSLFMSFNAARWVAVNALSTRVPPPGARARYISLQSAFTHAVCSVAAFASALFLKSEPSGRLVGMPALALVTAVLGLGVPVAVWRLEKLVPPPDSKKALPLPEL
jgi:predicted MFS family arabinose efflux permease